MAAKKMAGEKAVEAKGSDILFTDSTKYKRALGIVGMIQGKPATAHLKSEYSADLDNAGNSSLGDLIGKFKVLLDGAAVDAKDTDAAVLFVYKKLGGGVTTHARAAKVKEGVKKFHDAKKARKAAAKSDDGIDDDDEDDGDDEGDVTDDE